MAHGSKKAVITAIMANGIVTCIKFLAGIVSGSAAMMNEAVHSLMDTANQAFLFLGLREAERPADQTYAFGHGQKKYLWNLWSAIGLFSIGSGLGLAHAWHSWHEIGHGEIPEPFVLFGMSIEPLTLNLAVLILAFILEGYSFLVALREFLRRMREAGVGNPFRYLMESDDPTLAAVVLEDSVAMLGLVFAATGIILTAVTGQEEYDIIFSVMIALMLAVIAFYLGYVNMRFLADVRDEKAETAFRQVVEAHKEVERHHDLRSIIIDENHTILVAEIELREEAIVPGLYAQIAKRRDTILQTVPSDRRENRELRCYATARAAVESSLARAERIIDELEAEVRTLAPQVSHITVEVEGIATPPTSREG